MAVMQGTAVSNLAGVLALASSTKTTPGPDDPEKNLRNWSSLIGIITAIVGNVLIALALNLQRYAHIRLHRERARIRERVRAAERRAASSEYNTSHYGALNNNNGPAVDQRPRTNYFNGLDETWCRDGRRSPRRVASPGGGQEDDPKAPASSYLRSPYWWLGQVLISLGEMGNFLAYGFAPASIVSPLGVVALISNCVIAPMLFNETFRQRDFWGVAVAVAGVVTVVLSANQQETKLEPHDVWRAITTLEFEIYLAVTSFLIVALMWLSSACHRRTVLIDLGLVGLFGGYTALATKGVSSMLSSTLWRAFTTPVTYALVLVLLSTAILQIRYVNKALQRSDSTVVIPIQFVMFTLCVIIGSAVLYRDFERTTPRQAAKFIGGCLLTFFGVFLITSGRPPRDEDDESYADIVDSEEAIGLLHQDHSQSPEPSGGTVRSRTSRTSSRSSRSSRINFDAFTKPFSFQHGSGVPSSRGRQHEPAKLSSSNDMPLDPNPWLASDEDEGTAGILYESPTTANRPNAVRQNSATSDLLSTGPSTPRASVNPPPFSSDSELTTPNRPSTARLQSRHLAGPLINPSPLSSTVSAVVTDTLRRHGDRSLSHKSSLGRIRSSIRASLFISDDDDESGGRRPFESREPLLGDLTDVEEGQARGDDQDAKKRTRSLSDTLGELFRPRREGNGDAGNDGAGGSRHM